MALNFERQIKKNALLQTVFLAILSNGFVPVPIYSESLIVNARTLCLLYT